MSKKPQSGISRRTMLGAMAAAPVAVPAMAKEVAATAPNFGIMRVRGVPATFVGDLTAFGANMGDMVSGTFDPFSPESIDAVIRAPKLCVPQLSSDLDLSKCQDGRVSAEKIQIHDRDDDTPNRLFGSYINNDGDAV